MSCQRGTKCANLSCEASSLKINGRVNARVGITMVDCRSLVLKPYANSSPEIVACSRQKAMQTLSLLASLPLFESARYWVMVERMLAEFVRSAENYSKGLENLVLGKLREICIVQDGVT